MCAALEEKGADTLVCLGGLVWSDRRNDDQGAPVSVLIDGGRAFVDSRLISIGGGADEVMIQYVAKMLGF